MHRHLAEDEAVRGRYPIDPDRAPITGLKRGPAGSGGQEVVRVRHGPARSGFGNDYKVNAPHRGRQLTGMAIGS